MQKTIRKHDYVMKIVFVGTSAVGKTSILKRFADNEFGSFYISTIGIDFRFKSVTIDGNYVKMQMWDTAGQERFKGIAKSYYTSADAVIMVYDVNEERSFNDLKEIWMNEVEENCKDGVQIFVFCNKCDDVNQSIKPGHKKFFEEKKICYYLVSAKTGKGVQEALMGIGKKMISIVPQEKEKTLSMQLRESHFQGGNHRKEKQNKCC